MQQGENYHEELSNHFDILWLKNISKKGTRKVGDGHPVSCC